jgi:hypothetical protein
LSQHPDADCVQDGRAISFWMSEVVLAAIKNGHNEEC